MDTSKPFILLAQCTVNYHGRAKSYVGPGKRVIVHKTDGSFMVHGAKKITPLNYNGPKSTLHWDGKLVSTSPRGETITIDIIHIYNYIEIIDWSSEKVSLTGSEAQVRDYLIKNAETLLGIKVSHAIIEHHTRLGNVDLVLVDTDNGWHCIEVKRKRASINAVYQLHRYMGELPGRLGYLAAPAISPKAMAELARLGYQFIEVPVLLE